MTMFAIKKSGVLLIENMTQRPNSAVNDHLINGHDKHIKQF